MAVMNSASNFPRMMFDGDGFHLEDFFKWASMMSQQERTSIPLAALKERIFGDPLAKKYPTLPLRTIDERSVGEKIDYWRDWVGHAGSKDEFWDPIQLDDALKSVQAPVTMVTGWSDLFIKYQLQDFELLRANDKVSRITVGDWTHTAFGGMGAGIKDCLDWFGMHLKGEDQGQEALRTVSLWLNGANEWRECDSWPPVRDAPLQLSLAADRSLKPGPSTPLNASFVYDPSNPTPSLEGAKLLARTGREDVSSLLARSDVLAFDSAPCDADIEMVGEMSLTLTTAADSAYHDLFVVLCDVDDKQRCINITDGYQRLPRGPEDGSPRESTISMQPCFWRVKAGHRLRLLVCGGAFPRYARNLGLDGPLQDQIDSRKVEITVRAGALTLYRSEK
jgi:putative CocE/NonD family hydrolase